MVQVQDPGPYSEYVPQELLKTWWLQEAMSSTGLSCKATARSRLPGGQKRQYMNTEEEEEEEPRVWFGRTGV